MMRGKRPLCEIRLQPASCACSTRPPKADGPPQMGGCSLLSLCPLRRCGFYLPNCVDRVWGLAALDHQPPFGEAQGWSVASAADGVAMRSCSCGCHFSCGFVCQSSFASDDVQSLATTRQASCDCVAQTQESELTLQGLSPHRTHGWPGPTGRVAPATRCRFMRFQSSGTLSTSE